MTTLRLVLEYDGTDFHGWQAQPSLRTVAGVLAGAIEQVTGERPSLTAAGRTDSGAHSHGQVVGLTLDRRWEPGRLAGALNAALPDDVTIRHATPAAAAFHARFDALSRTYRYLVASRQPGSPLLRRHTWQVSGDLDLALMRAAARRLRGTHDFGAFGRSPRAGGSTQRTIDHVAVRRHRALGEDDVTVLVIEVSADAFLRGMMRGLAGALVAVGRGRMTVDQFVRVLSEPGRPWTNVVAPARGLHQWTVIYPATTEEGA